ncbi:hypothetical protein CF651_29460 [Paenibacillus rigui]|uniref:Uncharacterized protein n=1 Tax=Paenibacillus rigui TaxID=554312 RepID=A0A229UHC3_9BACL|nr:hypothetical protein CF651_29460 [Paenibacillus rigui]
MLLQIPSPKVKLPTCSAMNRFFQWIRSISFTSFVYFDKTHAIWKDGSKFILNAHKWAPPLMDGERLILVG